MSEGAPSTPAGSGAPPPTDEFLVNISIVSPSVNVNGPLKFPGLPPSTTVGQLKAKIRDALDSRPSNEKQRLIHQGKLLTGESDTLLQVFGEQKIRDSEQLIIHLVIREAADQQTSTNQPTLPRGQSPARIPDPRVASLFGGSPQTNTAHTPTHFGGSPQTTPHGHAHGPHIHQHVRLGRPGAIPGHTPSPFAAAFPGQTQPPGSGPFAPVAQQQQQLLHQYLNSLQQQREAQLRDAQMRAQVRVGPGLDQAADTQHAFGTNGLGTNSPQPDQQPQPYVREGIGPHGEMYRVTVNSTFVGPQGPVHPTAAPYPQQSNTPHGLGGPLSTNDVHNILRNADASQATSMMTNAMHRSASGASLANLNLANQRQPIPTPGVTVSRRPGSTVPLSRTATPENNMRTPSGSSSNLNPAARTAASNHSGQPEVYILSSPQGPRALLIHGPSELYFTPAGRPSLPLFAPHFSPPPPWLQPHPRMGLGTEFGQPAAQTPPVVAGAPAAEQAAGPEGNIRVNLYQGPPVQQQGLQQQGQQQQARPQPVVAGAVPMHPANPEGGLAGALAAALWPHIWLLIRLAIFVWWFTSSDTSWTRWATIMLLATAVFLFNTGLFNRMAHDWLNPLRQHLEGLLPLVGPEPNRNEANNNTPAGNAPPGHENNDSNNAAPRQPGEPNPAQVAARLVEQHRQRNANWLLDTIRRLERAGLLFLASIAPGVAERHIAAAERAERERQEAAERAERERREEQERAAAETATAAAANGDNEAPGAAADASQNGPAEQTGGNGVGEQQQQPVVAA